MLLRWLINRYRSSLLGRVNGELNSAIWPSQIFEVIASLKQRALTPAEAQQLLTELQQYFQGDEVVSATLATDVKVLCFFVRLRFSADPITPSIVAHLLDEEPRVSVVRYRTLVQHLLTAELKEWQIFFSQPAQVNLQALQERLRIIQRLRYLEYPLIVNHHELSTLPPLDNLEELPFGQWIYQFLSYYWRQLSRILQQWVFRQDLNEAFRLKSNDYIAVADDVLRLMVPFHPQLDSSQQAHFYKALHQWYVQGSLFWAEQPYFFDSQLAHFPDARRSWKEELQSIQYSLQQDREQLTQWAEFAFKGALMQLQCNEQQGVISFLQVYQQLQEKVRAFSTAAWAYRSRCELRLRTLSASDEDETRLFYLRSLHALDNFLLRQFGKFTSIVWNCFSPFPFLDNNPVMQDFKSYLIYLDSEFQYLSSLTHWLHHSCYCNDSSEGALIYEINQHFDEANYNPDIRYQNRETVFTMTDQVVRCLASKKWNKSLLALHPDKHPSYLAPLANYGFNQIGVLQKQAEHLIRLWQQGQWASAAPPNTLRLTTSQPLLESEGQEPTLARIEQPSTPLDLSVLDLKAEYIQKIKAKANLTKYPPEPSDDLTHQLYEGEDNEQDRERWELKQADKRVRKRQARELAEIRQETAGHNQKAKDYEREAEQHRREKEGINQAIKQTRQETEEMRQRLKKVAVATLTKELALTLQRRRPNTAAEATALLNEVITAVYKKPEHEACQIAVSDWQERDLFNLLLKIIKGRDDLHDLAHLLCLSQRMAESNETNPLLQQARNKQRLFLESIPFATESDYPVSSRQSFLS